MTKRGMSSLGRSDGTTALGRFRCRHDPRLTIIVLWVIPILVSSSQGAAKGRQGAAYGILGGWVGVLILAVMPARKDANLYGEVSVLS